MTIRARFWTAARAAGVGWLAGWLLVAPVQVVEAICNTGWAAAKTTPGLFAEVIVLSLLLWTVLSFGVACYCCCAFLFPTVWIISPQSIRTHRTLWVSSNIGFGFTLIALRAHVWTAFNRDGVGFTNFWVWAVYASIFFGVTAQRYQRAIRNAGAAEPVLSENHQSQLR